MKASIALLLLAAVSPLTAQQPAAADAPVISTASGAFFALSVPDADASARWYREKLGLSVTMDVPRTDASRVRAVILRGGGLLVELIQRDGSVKPEAPAGTGAPGVQGIFKVGVIVDDFDRTLAQLRSRGVEIAYGPYPRQPNQPPNLIIRDNAGNLIQVLGR